MSGLLAALPAPVQRYAVQSSGESNGSSSVSNAREAPPYLKRQGFVPRTQDDFSGGGAFPEVHVAQFPLDLGRPNRSTTIVPVKVDQDGQASFDAIVTQGRQGQIIHSKFSDLVEKDASKVIQARPDAESEAAAAARTAAALEGIVGSKLSAARPGNIPANAVSRPEDAKIIRYTPDEDAPGFNPAARTRVIKLVEAAVDPLEPPKFKHKKVPGGPPDAPVPVLHSPPRKVTVADQAAWSIPVCVSNWKTNRGYVVPLDKRVGADGRGLTEPTINDSFAKLSEALTIAERKARVEVETRAAIQRKLALRAKEEKEAELRTLAARARLERTGVATSLAGAGGQAHRRAGAMGFEGEALDDDGAEEYEEDRAGHAGAGAGAGAGSSRARGASHDDSGSARPTSMPMPRSEGESEAEYRARLERDRIRQDRKREREKELRMEAAGRKGKAARDTDRDMSEKIALGQATGAARPSGEALYDARLFNQAQADGGAGVGGGFTGDEEYGVYDKPWRGGAGGDAAVASAIYRPRSNNNGVLADSAAAEEVEVLRAGAAKRFKGEGEAGAGDGGLDFEGVRRGAAPPRSGPVEFERSSAPGAPVAAPGDDPFGFDSLMGGGAGAGGKRSALDAIGGRGGGAGMMRAAAGGGSTRDDLANGGSGRASIAFTSGGYTR